MPEKLSKEVILEMNIKNKEYLNIFREIKQAIESDWQAG